MGLGLPRRIWHDLSDETVQPQLDAGRCLLRALHIGQRAEPKVCVLHWDSSVRFFRDLVPARGERAANNNQEGKAD